jgi:hypothetical protein
MANTHLCCERQSYGISSQLAYCILHIYIGNKVLGLHFQFSTPATDIKIFPLCLFITFIEVKRITSRAATRAAQGTVGALGSNARCLESCSLVLRSMQHAGKIWIAHSSGSRWVSGG